MKYSYYPGCTLKNKAKDLDAYARASAKALGFEMEEIEDWQCCGGVYPLGSDEIATKLSSVRALNDAKEKGKSGVCLLGSKKQKHWLTDQSFAKSNGFEVVDTTDDGYELLALSFDGTFPRFTQKAKKQKIENKELTIYYDMQCPFVYQSLEIVKQYCEINNVPILMIQVDTLQKAKDLPCVFNNWAVFYHGEFETVNLLDKNTLTRLLKK